MASPGRHNLETDVVREDCNFFHSRHKKPVSREEKEITIPRHAAREVVFNKEVERQRLSPDLLHGLETGSTIQSLAFHF